MCYTTDVLQQTFVFLMNTLHKKHVLNLCLVRESHVEAQHVIHEQDIDLEHVSYVMC